MGCQGFDDQRGVSDILVRQHRQIVDDGLGVEGEVPEGVPIFSGNHLIRVAHRPPQLESRHPRGTGRAP